MGDSTARDGRRLPEAMIPMKEFILNNDRARFKWVHPIEDDGQMGQEQQADPRLQRHVKLKNTVLAQPFDKIEHLGNGRDTRVWKSYYAHEDSEYRRPLAVKIFTTIPSSTSPEQMEQALSEVEFMQPLCYPHLVTYVASYEMMKLNVHDQPIEHTIGIAMYPPGKDFGKTLQEISKALKKPDQTLKKDDQERILDMFGFFGCLVHTLSVLHHTDVCIKHKDVKPENIIIDDFNQPLFADFGLSKHYSKPTEQWTGGGTTWTEKYAAPEAKTPMEKVGYPCDIFALGCVFLEMVTLMLGVSLDELQQCIEEDCYYKAIDKTHEWLREKLRQRANPVRCGLDDEKKSALFKILPVVEKMMLRNPNERPKAETLWQEFKDLYSFTRSGEVCGVCDEDDPAAAEEWLRRMTELMNEPLVDPKEASDATIPPSEMEAAGEGRENMNSDHRRHSLANGANGGLNHRPPSSADSGWSEVSTRPRSSPPPSLSTTNTLSQARTSGKHKKILVFDDERSNMRGRKVYVQTTRQFQDNEVTPVPIPGDLVFTFNHPVEQVRSVDLKKQGFKVLYRALFRRNKHLYVLGRSSVIVNGQK